MRPLKPPPFTIVRSTPSSRANFHTDGPAWAREKPGSLMGGRPLPPAIAGDVASVAAEAAETTASAVADALPEVGADWLVPAALGAACFGAAAAFSAAGAPCFAEADAPAVGLEP